MPERIVTNQEIAGGAPVVRGSQIPVHQILDRIAVGKTPTEIITELPQLDLEDIRAALVYASYMVRQRTASEPAALGVSQKTSRPAPTGTESIGDSSALDLNKILIVDDQEINRLYMQTMFRDSGFEFSVASSSQEALEIARAELPFLVLTDVQMPFMDGFELCRQLKADDKTKAAAVIFVTAHHRSSKKVIEGLEIGADDYIFRPFERGEMLSRIRAVARLKRAEAEARRIAIENARLFGEVQEFNRRLERKVAERTRELAEEKERTEAILASMADGLLVLDAENHILTSNAVAESMLDFQLIATQGQPINTDGFANPLWQNIKDLVVSDELANSVLLDIPDPTSPDRFLSIQALAARVRDETGQTLGTVIVLRDITAITEVERMKASFMSGITHELKTPLAVIHLHANNLQAYYDRLTTPKRNELLSGIQSQVKLLEQLVEDILTLSRLDATEVVGERLTIDLIELAGEVLTDLLPLANVKKISLRWTKPKTEVTVLAERDHLKQLIRNLVDNAIKYTPTGGLVELTIASDGSNTAIIRVADNGLGIPPEHQSRVFERFYRVDSSHTIPGTGLGLSIVEEIVTSYGGDIQLESTPGQGSIFTVRLPHFQDAEASTAATEEPPAI